MIWLEKHINLFFKINGIFMLLIVVFGIWTILLLGGIPHNSPFTWTSYQWNMINFLWTPTVIYSAIYILFSILCFMRKYFIFPIILLFLITSPNSAIENLSQIMTYGFLSPARNISGIVGALEFIFAIFGTILWIRKIRGKNMKVNG